MKKTKLQIRWAINAIILLEMMEIGLVIPMIPAKAKALGASATSSGLLLSLYGTLQFLSSPFIGGLGDVVGRRVLLQLSCIGICVGYAMVGIASSMIMLVLSRIPVGILKHTMTLSQAYLSSMTSRAERSSAMGQLNMAASLGFIGGSSLGGFLSTKEYQNSPAFVAAALGLLCFALASWIPPDNPQKNTNKDKTTDQEVKIEPIESKFRMFLKSIRLSGLRLVWEDAILYKIVTVRLATGFTIVFFDYALSLALEYLYELDSHEKSALFTIRGVVATGVQGFLIPWLVARVNSKNCMLLGLFSSFVSYLLLALSINSWILYFALVPLEIGTSICRTIQISLVTSASPQSIMGQVLGLTSSIMALSRAIAPLFSGLLMDWIHPAFPLWMTAFATSLVFYYGKMTLPEDLDSEKKDI